MGDAPVHDDGLFYPLGDGADAALHLGDHAAGDYALGEQLGGLAHRDLGDQRRWVLGVAQHAGDVGHQDQALRPQRPGDAGRGGVAVDVVDLPVLPAAHGGDYGDVAPVQQVRDRRGVHPCDLADKAQARILALGLDHAPVDAAQADGLSALGAQKPHQRLVDLARQHHLDDIDRLRVRHPQAVNELRLFAQAVHQLADLRPAAVYQHHPDPHQAQQHDILHDLHLQRFVYHGVAAVFHHDGLAAVLLDVGQGLDQHLRPLLVCKLFSHVR